MIHNMYTFYADLQIKGPNLLLLTYFFFIFPFNCKVGNSVL
jgi:hypothetical protein